MSSKPLFLRSRDDLLKRLRLDGVGTKESTHHIIDSAITEVRVGLYNALGSTRVSQIQGYGIKDSPETDDEYVRADTCLCEEQWVRARLLRSLNVFFADNSGGAQEEWNELGLLREGSDDIKDTIEDLMTRVKDSLERLVTRDPTAKAQVRAFSLEPDTRLEPGSSIWG